MNNTRDLSKFGYRELDMAGDLLKAIKEQGLPENFDDQGVTVEFNPNSGEVFLVNDEYQTAMMNGDKLEQWFSCPYCGKEGFAQEIEDDRKHSFDDDGNINCPEEKE